MTAPEPEQELKHVPVEDIAEHEKDGWHIAAAYQRAEHHTRYSIVMFRDIPERTG